MTAAIGAIATSAASSSVVEAVSSSELPPTDAPTSRAAASITVWAADLVVPATICAWHQLPRGRDLFLLRICRAVKIMYGLILGYIEMRSENR